MREKNKKAWTVIRGKSLWKKTYCNRNQYWHFSWFSKEERVWFPDGGNQVKNRDLGPSYIPCIAGSSCLVQ